MSSAVCFSLDLSKILSSGNGLNASEYRKICRTRVTTFLVNTNSDLDLHCSTNNVFQAQLRCLNSDVNVYWLTYQYISGCLFQLVV